MARTAGTTSTSTVVAKVTGTRDEIIALQASAQAHVTRRRTHTVRLILALAIVPCLLLASTDVGPLAIPFAAFSVFYRLMMSQRLMQQRFARIFRRIPSAGEPWTLTAEWHNVQVVAQTCSSTWSWENIAEVTDYEGGVLLVFHGACNVVYIPATAFADDAARDRAKALMAGWQEASVRAA